MPQPSTAIIPADALDVSGLRPDARQPGPQDSKQAVSGILAGDLQAFGLDCTIKVTEDTISVSWVDAVMCMQKAFPVFAKMSPMQMKQAALELAMSGQQDFDRKDLTPKHSLKGFPGAFGGMKIVSYMYAAFQQLMPGVDVGIDLSKEYAAVKGK